MILPNVILNLISIIHLLKAQIKNKKKGKFPHQCCIEVGTLGSERPPEFL